MVKKFDYLDLDQGLIQTNFREYYQKKESFKGDSCGFKKSCSDR